MGVNIKIPLNITKQTTSHELHGGLYFAINNSAALSEPIKTISLPKRLILPLQQHKGSAAVPLVKIGDSVLKGQLIADTQEEMSIRLHAPTSGKIFAIEDCAVSHPLGLITPCMIIEPDGAEQWITRTPITNFTAFSATEIFEKIHKAGIVGLGGAAFPTAVKLNSCANNPLQTLIINAIECEPYICCDEALIREHAHGIIAGIRILQHALNVKNCFIALADNKPEAYHALKLALQENKTTNIELKIIPARYPSGDEKQLIKALTGLEIPHDDLPAAFGLMCHNVATVYAIHRAIEHNEPLISRVVTVCGDGIRQAHNIDVLFGTPIEHLIMHCGGYQQNIYQLIMGGPMMGFALTSDELPVIKSTNCILVYTSDLEIESVGEKSCIRCGACEQVCPVNLLPQQLYWHAKTQDFAKAESQHLFDCIECGCCSYVCPSEIPLVQYYRFAKTEITQINYNHQKSNIARARFEARQARLDAEERIKQEMLQQKKQALETQKTTSLGAQVDIQAALARVNAKKKIAFQNDETE
ncbi:MAG: electron transport complex subunit RsxC [Gammaproteobacteria bacterium]|nr:electron transport complex subunit RsxC [Gammaproteobacteria bacterium]